MEDEVLVGAVTEEMLAIDDTVPLETAGKGMAVIADKVEQAHPHAGLL